MLGRPIPKIMHVTIVNTSVNIRLLPPMLMMVLAILRAKPVIEQEPTMIPTQAQAMATDTVDFALATMASRISWTLMRVFFLHSATIIVNTMV